MNNKPISALSLPLRLENSLRRNKIVYLNDLQIIDEELLGKIKNIGPKSVQLIKKSLKEYLILKENFSEKSLLNKDLQSIIKMISFSKLENSAFSTINIYDEHKEISNINTTINEDHNEIENNDIVSNNNHKQVANYPIFSINLPERIENSLIKSNINTLSSLANCHQSDLLKIKNIGQTSINIIISQAKRFISKNFSKIIDISELENIDSFNDISSLLKELLTKQAIESRKNLQSKSKEEMILDYFSDLETYLNDFIQSNILTNKEKIILNNRLRIMKNNSSIRTYTLEEIGNNNQVNLTRERVRQLEKKLLIKLSNKIDFFNSFHFNEHQLIRTVIINYVNQLGFIQWPNDLPLLINELNVNNKLLNIKFYEYLTFREINKISGLNEYKYKDLSYFFYNDDFNRIQINNILKNCINRLKKYEYPIINENDLYDKSLLNTKEVKLIRDIISKLSDFIFFDNQYKIKEMKPYQFAYLILEEHNNPMHYEILFNKIKERTNVGSILTFKNSLLNDKHIITQGNGMYALNKWGLKRYKRNVHYGKNTVKNLIREYIAINLNASNDQIKQYVLSKRNAADTTITQGISDVNQKLNRHSKKISIPDLIIEFFSNHKEANFKQIYTYIEKRKHNVKKGQVYTAIYNYCKKNDEGNYYLYKNKKKRVKNNSIKEKLILCLKENTPLTLDEIFVILSKNNKVSKNTIRSYISSLEIKQDENGKYSL